VPFDPSLLFLGVLFVLMFLVLQRGNRQRRELSRVQANIAPGAEVMTASGMLATVTAVDDDVVTLETAPGQRSRWDRRAVARIITPPATTETAPGEVEPPA